MSKGPEAVGQISLLEGHDLWVNIGQTDTSTSFTVQRELNIDHLLGGEKPIYYTKNGDPVFPADKPEEYYSRPFESRETNPLFLKQQEIDFSTEMAPLFKKICGEVLIMQAENDSREIFYIPKDTRLFVEPKKTGALYPADSKDRFFVVTNGTVMFNGKGKDIRTAYELLPGFSRRISIKSRENDFGESITKPVQIAKDSRFTIPSIFLEGERYFNLSQAAVFDDFDHFCDFIKKCDEIAQKSKLLRQS